MCARIDTGASRCDVDEDVVDVEKPSGKQVGDLEVAYPTPISRHQIYNSRTYIDSWNLFMLALYNHFL
jgi:hypothetical protein